MATYSAKKAKDGKWDIWQHQDGFKRHLCYMSSDDILELFNKTVPKELREPFLIGDPKCKHSWRTWKFNPIFEQCAKCPAMNKIIKLVPMEYKHG